MRFHVFPCDLEGVGCYRIIYPYGTLEQNTHHEVIVKSEGPVNGRALLSCPPAAVGGKHDQAADEFLESDVYVFQRPLELILAPLAAWLKSHGKTVVVDIDDWFEGIRHQGAVQIARSPRHDVGTVRRILHHADLLTVSTPRLAELYGRDVPRVEVLPNFLLRRDWTAPLAYQQDRGKVRVGWQGWLRYRGNDLKVLKRVLPKLLHKHPEAIFVNVGRPDALDYLRVPGLHVEGAIFPHHAAKVAEIDIGLVPLTHNVFNECKSSLKAQEYGACGAPCIASPSGPNIAWCDGTNGLIAANPKEWVEALDALLEGDRWRPMGAANREKSQAHMIDERWTEWAALYEPAAKMAA